MSGMTQSSQRNVMSGSTIQETQDTPKEGLGGFVLGGRERDISL